MEKYELINDFLVDEGNEIFVGILIKYKTMMVWLFNNPIHGSYLAFGNDPKVTEKQRWCIHE